MEHDDRVRRLNGLLNILPVQAEIGDTDAWLDVWEAILVRAAAEITGLTWSRAYALANDLSLGGIYGVYSGPDDLVALFRYAELAK